jgi:hypothetical protein
VISPSTIAKTSGSSSTISNFLWFKIDSAIEFSFQDYSFVSIVFVF